MVRSAERRNVCGLHHRSAWWSSGKAQTRYQCPSPLIIFLQSQAQEFCSNMVRVIIAGNSITDKPVKASTVKDSKVNA